ncbi:MAG: PAS domain S-box protein [Pseudomonadota bacterium]
MIDNETKIRIANNRLITAERYYWAADIAALLVVWTIWPYVSHAQALLAGSGLVLANHLLSVIGYLFNRDKARDSQSDFWEKWLIAGNLIAGSAWGLISALLFKLLPQNVTPALMMISTLLIAAWSIANVPATKCVYAFSLPAGISLLLAMLLYGSPWDYAISLIIPLFLISLLKHTRLVAAAYRASTEQLSGLQKLAKTEAQRGELISQDYARLRHLLDAVPVPVIVSNMASGLLVYLNQAALDLIGIKDLSEKPGARGVDFFATPEERDKAVAKIANNDVIPVEFQLKRADGSLFWAYYTASQLVYEGEPAIIGTITDVTTRRKAEEELRQSEERYRLLADHAHDMISIYSPASVCLYASPSVERLFGYRQDEFIGQPLSKFIHPEDLETIISINVRSAKTGEAHPVYLSRMRHKSGHWEWVETTNTVEVDSVTGKIMQVSSVSRLVTERVHNEQELREARERAESADRAKSDFLAHMSHEIRTPLNAVIGFSEVMRDQLFGPLGSERYLEYTNDIYNSGTHLLALINEVLDLSKIEAGKFELQEDRVPLNTIIEAAFRFVRERAESKLIALQCSLHAAPDLWCDRRIFTQVMLNIVGNAIKFTPERGRITVESILDTGGNLILTVTDTGIGIAQEDIPMVMKPFGQTRTSQHIAAAEPGTGLGLPLSKSFIEKHGGTLSITSEVGIGTRVIIIIPAARVMDDHDDIGVASTVL